VNEASDQIGELLKAAREKAGMTLDDAVFKTRLPKSAIEALENENFSSFTSPVYAKSFLAQYSGFFNIDAGPWLDALKPSTFIEGDPLFPVLELGSGGQEESAPLRGSASGWRAAVWLLLFSGVLVFVALKGFHFFESRLGKEYVESEIARPATPMVKPQAEPSPSMPQVLAPAAIPQATAVAEAPALEEPPSPTPRAIIVR
jgi:cytoskeleton protein RodZ